MSSLTKLIQIKVDMVYVSDDGSQHIRERPQTLQKRLDEVAHLEKMFERVSDVDKERVILSVLSYQTFKKSGIKGSNGTIEVRN